MRVRVQVAQWQRQAQGDVLARRRLIAVGQGEQGKGIGRRGKVVQCFNSSEIWLVGHCWRAGGDDCSDVMRRQDVRRKSARMRCRSDARRQNDDAFPGGWRWTGSSVEGCLQAVQREFFFWRKIAGLDPEAVEVTEHFFPKYLQTEFSASGAVGRRHQDWKRRFVENSFKRC